MMLHPIENSETLFSDEDGNLYERAFARTEDQFIELVWDGTKVVAARCDVIYIPVENPLTPLLERIAA